MVGWMDGWTDGRTDEHVDFAMVRALMPCLPEPVLTGWVDAWKHMFKFNISQCLDSLCGLKPQTLTVHNGMI